MPKATSLFFLVLLFWFPCAVFAQHQATRDDGRKIILFDNKTWAFADSGTSKHKRVSSKKLEIPKLKPDEELIEHNAFALVYAEKYEQAKWVAYQLTASETQKEFVRTDRFMLDPKIRTGSAEDADYKGSGYDRGHLAPASDMGWSATSMAESFYYSNMSPQAPTFNRGIWKKGEDLVRQWAKAYNTLYVVVGPVLKADLATIGPNKVAVPERYFKVILDHEGPETKAIAFLIANEGSKEPLQSFAVSVDSVEKVTGIDFFPTLPDEEEKQLEKEVCISCWEWGSSISAHTEKVKGSTGLTLCKWKDPDGKACQNYVPGGKSFCSEHMVRIISPVRK